MENDLQMDGVAQSLRWFAAVCRMSRVLPRAERKRETRSKAKRTWCAPRGNRNHTYRSTSGISWVWILANQHPQQHVLGSRIEVAHLLGPFLHYPPCSCVPELLKSRRFRWWVDRPQSKHSFHPTRPNTSPRSAQSSRFHGPAAQKPGRRAIKHSAAEKGAFRGVISVASLPPICERPGSLPTSRTVSETPPSRQLTPLHLSSLVTAAAAAASRRRPIDITANLHSTRRQTVYQS